MAKLSVGRLRPNFLSVCNITYASINCAPGTYVSQAPCRQPQQKLVEEARCVEIYVLSWHLADVLMCNFLHHHVLSMLSFRKSFFSGHASFAMYTMLYLAVSHTFLSIERHLCIHLMFVLDHFIPVGVTATVLEPNPTAYGRRQGTPPLDESPAPSIWGFSAQSSLSDVLWNYFVIVILHFPLLMI